MLTKLAYAYYQAGIAVAAIHLKLSVKEVSINPARGSADIAVPKSNVLARITLYLAALAAEKKGVGETDPLRRTKNRQRITAELAAQEKSKQVSKSKSQSQKAKSVSLVNQAQDRANAICASLFPAIEKIARRLIAEEFLTGPEIEKIVNDCRAARQHPPEE
jgi:hypothetical protein